MITSLAPGELAAADEAELGEDAGDADALAVASGALVAGDETVAV